MSAWLYDNHNHCRDAQHQSERFTLGWGGPSTTAAGPAQCHATLPFAPRGSVASSTPLAAAQLRWNPGADL